VVNRGCFIIAEAGVNHNGSVELALKLVDAAADAGADAVKFQTFRAEALVVPGAPKAAYQVANSTGSDQFSMLRALELKPEAYAQLRDRCTARGIEFMSTPFDLESALWLAGLGMKRIKIASGELTNLPLLRGLAGLGLPLVLSTGMSTLDEVAEAVRAIGAQAQGREAAATPPRLTLLHCTSNYPAAEEDVNLRAMLTLRDTFGLPVGYSDHTGGTAVALAAAALGASVIEKHFTLDQEFPGPDHRASLEPEAFAQMVQGIRAVEIALGNGVKEPRPAELPVRDLVRRSVTLTRAVCAGEALHPDHLALLRPGTGIAPRDLPAVAGRRAARDLDAGATLRWEDLLP
jgi:N-acetylneuraminate synthase